MDKIGWIWNGNELWDWLAWTVRFVSCRSSLYIMTTAQNDVSGGGTIGRAKYIYESA